MLRLAHPAPSGQPTDPPRRRKFTRAPALSFTVEEVRHLRAAARNAARAYGGTDVLAAAMGVPVDTLYKLVRRRPSGILAIRLASAAGVPLETILSGKLAAVPSSGSSAEPAPGGAS